MSVILHISFSGSIILIQSYSQLIFSFGTVRIGLTLGVCLLTLFMQNLQSGLKTDSLREMNNLKLLQLNFVELAGSYENLSEDLRWLCWHGFRLRTLPSELFIGNLVALDMSYSRLEVFEPPMVGNSVATFMAWPFLYRVSV